jgi:hypothetical protein
MVRIAEIVRVFISSKQQEFRQERQGIQDMVASLPLLAPDLAEDWSPEREPVENTFLRRVRSAPIYVGLFGCIYSASTCLEYETACENPHREVLVYIRECQNRDPRLADFVGQLNNPERGHTIKQFHDWEDLKPYFERHLWDAVRRMIDNYVRLAEPEPVTRAADSIRARRWRETRERLLGLGLPGAYNPKQAAAWAQRLIEMLPD